MQVDRLTLAEATQRVLAWTADASPERCRYVVTPNVDHAVMLQTHARLYDAYLDASLVVADGAPLVAAARLLGRRLPERVAGSDLVPAVLAAADAACRAGGQRTRVFLLGAGPGVAERAAGAIARRWPGVEVVGVDCPPVGFEKCDRQNERILEAVRLARPDLLVIGLGAPKQELWVHRFHERLEAKAAICAGATIDFLAGEKRRAPAWMQRTGLEWLHRLATEPRRLAKRYATDAWVFPQLVWREYWGEAG
ncbi:WecB/TagA/CpsF family glycosyltransferase [Botrimarina sp.]|uniref:WecB/TagA/CpsF family glycosyltransferase n=1 Tax=Botrimarina sp. TaxID=2795802 RepID=UPI0032EFEE3B